MNWILTVVLTGITLFVLSLIGVFICIAHHHEEGAREN